MYVVVTNHINKHRKFVVRQGEHREFDNLSGYPLEWKILAVIDNHLKKSLAKC